MPDDLARPRRAPSPTSAAVCASTSAASSAVGREAAQGRRSRAGGSARTMSSTADAPAARASSTCSSERMKSLRSTGTRTRADHGAQVIERAAEVGAVGEHRDRRRAAVARSAPPSRPGPGPPGCSRPRASAASPRRSAPPLRPSSAVAERRAGAVRPRPAARARDAAPCRAGSVRSSGGENLSQGNGHLALRLVFG